MSTEWGVHLPRFGERLQTEVPYLSYAARISVLARQASIGLRGPFLMPCEWSESCIQQQFVDGMDGYAMAVMNQSETLLNYRLSGRPLNEQSSKDCNKRGFHRQGATALFERARTKNKGLFFSGAIAIPNFIAFLAMVISLALNALGALRNRLHVCGSPIDD